MLRQTCYYHYFSVVLCSFSSLFLPLYIFFFLLKTVLSFFSRPYRRGPIYIRVSRVSSSTRTRRRTHTRIKLRTMGFQLYTEMQQSSCNVLLGIEIWRKFIRFERKARVGERGPQQWPIIAKTRALIVENDWSRYSLRKETTIEMVTKSS